LPFGSGRPLIYCGSKVSSGRVGSGPISNRDQSIWCVPIVELFCKGSMKSVNLIIKDLHVWNSRWAGIHLLPSKNHESSVVKLLNNVVPNLWWQYCHRVDAPSSKHLEHQVSFLKKLTFFWTFFVPYNLEFTANQVLPRALTNPKVKCSLKSSLCSIAEGSISFLSFPRNIFQSK